MSEREKMGEVYNLKILIEKYNGKLIWRGANEKRNKDREREREKST